MSFRNSFNFKGCKAHLIINGKSRYKGKMMLLLLRRLSYRILRKGVKNFVKLSESLKDF